MQYDRGNSSGQFNICGDVPGTPLGGSLDVSGTLALVKKHYGKDRCINTFSFDLGQRE
jgi:hypothetical protein